MTLLLGIYTNEFYRIQKETGYMSFTKYLKKNKIILTNNNELKYYLEKAILKSDKIFFLLDSVYLPLDIDKSVTCYELNFIYSNKELMDKTIFMKQNAILLNELVKKEYFYEKH